MLKILTLSLLALSFIYAEDAAKPLPKEAQAVMQACTVSVNKAKTDAVVKLLKVQEAVTKKGSLEDALAVKNLVEKLKSEIADASAGGMDVFGQGDGKFTLKNKDLMDFIKKNPKWMVSNGKMIIFDAKQSNGSFCDDKGKPSLTAGFFIEKQTVHFFDHIIDFSKFDGEKAVFMWSNTTPMEIKMMKE